MTDDIPASTPAAQSDASIDTLFVTRVYRVELAEMLPLNEEVAACCLTAAEDDGAGQRWSDKHGYTGYTSYASLDDLIWRFPILKKLKAQLDRHAKAFAKVQDWDLGGRKLELDSLWINVLDPGGFHGSHIHPNSVISGTYYVRVPAGASVLKFEDPRLPFMMAAPPRKAKADRTLQPTITVAPREGTLLMWESWLRHEVALNRADEERISLSFNYAWR
ncbi:TIGR02466 family protein [Nitrospirillum sp. BR 11163]|uniref:TIGR02466 family protein n=1 Tax=Nitrospirillum sp. BR 11163 TaxID=3104323 RepID=UPI002AFED6BB|nr:TIGR02466 family protein [Nitrospirillum sp. BR 11163]MEA1672639.1 TIGR02466 family protein [Nitrospirillum sp. BR 11163]